MDQGNAQKTVSLNDEKALSNTSSTFEITDKNQFDQQLSSIQHSQQISSAYATLGTGNGVSQMSLYPPRYYYQYYMPHSTLSPSAFGACGMYGNVPGSEINDYRPKDKRRRCRTVFTQDQLAVLESEFLQQHYPDNKLRRTISTKSGLAEDRVQVWFQNRRAKEKRLMEEKMQFHRSQSSSGNSVNDCLNNGAETIACSSSETMAAIQTIVNSNETPNNEVNISQVENTEYVTVVPTQVTEYGDVVERPDNVVYDQTSRNHLLLDNPQSTNDTPLESTYSSSPEYLPAYTFGTYPSDSCLESGIEAPVRCRLVTESNELEGLAEVVIMDTGIQSSAPENLEEHLIEEI